MSREYKVIVLGNPNVGKTSLILRWVDGIFNENETAAVDTKSKKVKVGSRDVTLSITDTAGQERFRTLTSSYYRNAHAIIVVYDITDEDSFTDVEAWVEEGQKYANDSKMFLVGQKSDLADERKTEESEGKEYAEREELGFYMETSAKTGQNVDALFAAVAKQLEENNADADEPEDKKKKDKKDGKVDLHKKTKKHKKKRCIV